MGAWAAQGPGLSLKQKTVGLHGMPCDKMIKGKPKVKLYECLLRPALM